MICFVIVCKQVFTCLRTRKMKRKIKKLFKHPQIFFRDYLNKKYPDKNIEQPFSEQEEKYIELLREKLNNLVVKNHFSSFPIDVVFTWVNHLDHQWLEKFSHFSPKWRDHSALYATDSARFEDHNELYYSVNAVLKFMPWVRKIFIVTDNQKPVWLNETYRKKIEIIDHKQIIDEQFLPTFNSHVIEANLHHIPDLSEHFIYFNDDVFVAKPLEQIHFFQPNGLASIFLADKSIDALEHRGMLTPTLIASKNNIALLEKDYRCKIDTPIVHTYSPLCKSIYELAWNKYPDEIRGFLGNKFRSSNDLNFTNFLIPWLMYLEGKSIPRSDICYYFNIRSPNALAQYRKLLQLKHSHQQPDSFCANDFNSNSSIAMCQEKLNQFLAEYYAN